MVEVVGAEEAGVMVMVEVLLDGNRNRNVIVDLGVYFNLIDLGVFQFIGFGRVLLGGCRNEF